MNDSFWSKYRFLNLLLSLFIALFLVSLAGCKSDTEEEEAAPAATEENSDGFTPSAEAVTLTSSIIDLPDSISQTSDSTTTGVTLSSMSSIVASSVELAAGDGGGDGGMAGIYGGIPAYVGMTEMFVGMLKDVLSHIIGQPFLEQATRDTIIAITDAEADGPTGFMIEEPVGVTGEAYEKKISLYFSEAVDGVWPSPGLIIRYSLEGEGAKGRLLLQMQETETIQTANTYDFSITRGIDITFDGTTATKNLQMRLVQDLSNLFYTTTSNYIADPAILTASDIGQPAKVFVDATHDGLEFSISGTSYHPGWKIESELKGDDPFWGEAERTMYMFKAKAIESPVNGAQVYLALPLETATSNVGVWTDDAIGTIFSNMMLNNLNTYIDTLANSAVATDNRQADWTMVWITQGSILAQTLAEHGPTFTQAEYDAATTYWSDSDFSNLFASLTVDEFNTWFQALDEILDTDNDIKQSQMYLVMMLPTVATSGHGYSVSQTELNDFVTAADTGDDNTENFKAQYKSISSMTNPAFFSEADGFLGTLNGTDFYNYLDGALTEGDTPSIVTNYLNVLDLSSIDPYVPADVVSATITVE